MTSPRQIYWDTSCFICFLNEDEDERRVICKDVLHHAELGEIEIWTSMLTITEVVRPRKPKPTIPPLPPWAIGAIKADPSCRGHIETVWNYYHHHTAAHKTLSKEEIDKISLMFEWECIGKILFDEIIAQKAVELCRDYGIRPADAIHAASAMQKKVEVLQNWDRDFGKVKHLIVVEEPKMITQLPPLLKLAAEQEKMSAASQTESKTPAGDKPAGDASGGS